MAAVARNFCEKADMTYHLRFFFEHDVHTPPLPGPTPIPTSLALAGIRANWIDCLLNRLLQPS